MIRKGTKEITNVIEYNIYYCDRCKQECDLQQSINTITHLTGSKAREDFHLCHNCYAQFMGFRDQEKTSTGNAILQAIDEVAILPANHKEKSDDFNDGWFACLQEQSKLIRQMVNEECFKDKNLNILLGLDVGSVNEFADGSIQFALNMSDIFYYACTDSEEVSPEEYDQVIDCLLRYGLDGLTYWVARKRQEMPKVNKHKIRVSDILIQKSELDEIDKVLWDGKIGS